MDWIEALSTQEDQKTIFKRLTKFTLYDHNYTCQVDEKERTFTCLLNLKKLNRVYNTICQIDGDFKIGQIQFRCWLLDQQHIIHGQWQYQKIQLTRFAFRYNQRSYRNIFIKTNPANGQVVVTLAFFTNEIILEDQNQFREIITDLCHSVGEESQMIFNTMLEIIFGRQANQPYLKSAIKVNPGFPRYMKVEKLLDKIKTLITTSCFYKIRSDISSAHKNRSYFKKIYLNKQKKLIHNPQVLRLALLYEPKCSTQYQQFNSKSKEKLAYFIKDYIELEQKNEIQFAKHLNEDIEKSFVVSALQRQAVKDIKYDQGSSLFQLWFSPQQSIKARGHKMQSAQLQHQAKILQQIKMRHPNMFHYFLPENLPSQAQNYIFWHYQQQIPLLDYLRKNSRTMSLSTKLHIMTQICAFVRYLHKQSICYFIQLENIFITKGLEVRIGGFKRSFKVAQWLDILRQSKPQDIKKQQEKISFDLMLMKRQELVQFPYRFVLQSQLNNEKCDVMSLAVCLYRIMMDKFPFLQRKQEQGKVWTKEEWLKMWTVQAEYFLSKGGEIVKIIAHLLLKSMEIQDIAERPYVEWLLVILSQIKTSLNGLY